ncbi:MAG: Uroporphyrinogen-III synthase [Candidatus Moanabacter tarae]|uniref:Uroporphyrinogen-III synthase n=1 Tax=Candidatus Moanibacter tarae TaxID=2200854 RepID=A0A2Z4ADI6_9BACT|nr:MAG: Uroporphyrinogen-III synthase [Candidatus Moanabacter tarae]|tara:strand:+ start:819 stop:1619 length:801 start_codon:yes stop_codon:yes gene_type:complete
MNQKREISLPLAGRRIIVTRNTDQAGGLSSKLRKVGADVIELPLIEIQPDLDKETVEDVFAEINSYEWLVFTSANGVRFFFDIFFKWFIDIRALGLVRIAAIGKATANAIKNLHLKVEIVPEKPVSEELARALEVQQTLDNTKILVVTGNLNRDVLVKRLEKARAIVDTLPVYRTVSKDISSSPDVRDFRKKGADAILFTSSSAVRTFSDQSASLKLESGAILPLTCSIGPITSGTMRKLGMLVDMEAEEQSTDGIVTTLIKEFDE